MDEEEEGQGDGKAKLGRAEEGSSGVFPVGSSISTYFGITIIILFDVIVLCSSALETGHQEIRQLQRDS